MRISEIFYSIQGEGKLLGMPSVFIRTSGCNLRCVWCDTPYASWDAGGQGDAEMTVDAILAEVERLGHGAGYIVLTGGEPMMFKETVQLIAELKCHGKHVTVETAGTLWLEGLPAGGIDLGSISPKLSNSVPRQREGGRFAQAHERQRTNMEVLRRFATGEDGVVKECQWKFVISAEEDLIEMEVLIERLNGELPEANRLRAHDILLMPEGIDAPTLAERSLWLAEICKGRGYRLTPRLHVHLWGNKRGT